MRPNNDIIWTPFHYGVISHILEALVQAMVIGGAQFGSLWGTTYCIQILLNKYYLQSERTKNKAQISRLEVQRPKFDDQSSSTEAPSTKNETEIMKLDQKPWTLKTKTRRPKPKDWTQKTKTQRSKPKKAWRPKQKTKLPRLKLEERNPKTNTRSLKSKDWLSEALNPIVPTRLKHSLTITIVGTTIDDDPPWIPIRLWSCSERKSAPNRRIALAWRLMSVSRWVSTPPLHYPLSQALAATHNMWIILTSQPPNELFRTTDLQTTDHFQKKATLIFGPFHKGFLSAYCRCIFI